MKALEKLSDSAMTRLAVATNVTGPAQRMAPKFWNYFGDLVAVEIAHRHGLQVDEPGFPDLSDEELEAGALVLAAMAQSERTAEVDPDPATADVLTAIAEDVVKIRTSGLFSLREGPPGN